METAHVASSKVGQVHSGKRPTGFPSNSTLTAICYSGSDWKDCPLLTTSLVLVSLGLGCCCIAFLLHIPLLLISGRIQTRVLAVLDIIAHLLAFIMLLMGTIIFNRFRVDNSIGTGQNGYSMGYSLALMIVALVLNMLALAVTVTMLRIDYALGLVATIRKEAETEAARRAAATPLYSTTTTTTPTTYLAVASPQFVVA